MKRVTLFAGHYGSGKTNLAVDYALSLIQQGIRRVAIADLDIVNPYFRTKDSEAVLTAAGIRLISSPYANSNVDVPAIPAEMYAIVDDLSTHFVVDVGGDDRGATALGRYAGQIMREGDYEMRMVVNFYRPLTQTPEDAWEVMKEIEAAAHIRCTGLVNNSNLGAETCAEDVRKTLPRMQALSQLAGLPIIETTAVPAVVDEMRRVCAAEGCPLPERLTPVEMHFKPEWKIQ